MQAFSHFTHFYSKGRAMVTDLQGIVEKDIIYLLTDPAVHTADPAQLKDPTNFGAEGMSAFFHSHVCNTFCELLNLKLPNNLDVNAPIEPDFSSTDGLSSEAYRDMTYSHLETLIPVVEDMQEENYARSSFDGP